jgi:hypothetical protein
VEIVKQQLLVDPGAPGDLFDTGAIEAAPSELAAGCRDDP